MKKALHIAANDLEIMRTDGPSLLIKMQNRSPLRFPFSRISRITLSGETDRGLQALCRCAAEQIPVHVLNGRGKVLCQILPPIRYPDGLHLLLEQLACDDTLAPLYDEWLDNQRRALLKDAGVDSGDPELRLRQVREAIRTLVRQHHCQAMYQEALQWIEGFFFSELSQILHNYRLDTYRTEVCELQQDVVKIMSPWLECRLYEALPLDRGQINASGMVRIYHHYCKDVEFLVRRMLNHLTSRLDGGGLL